MSKPIVIVIDRRGPQIGRAPSALDAARMVIQIALTATAAVSVIGEDGEYKFFSAPLSFPRSPTAAPAVAT